MLPRVDKQPKVRKEKISRIGYSEVQSSFRETELGNIHGAVVVSVGHTFVLAVESFSPTVLCFFLSSLLSSSS